MMITYVLRYENIQTIKISNLHFYFHWFSVGSTSKWIVSQIILFKWKDKNKKNKTKNNTIFNRVAAIKNACFSHEGNWLI